MDQKYKLRLDTNDLWPTLSPATRQDASVLLAEELELDATIRVGRIVVGKVEHANWVPDCSIEIVINYDFERVGEVVVVQ